jgi:hypothetical protein
MSAVYFFRMDVGEAVSVLSAFPGVSSHCAFGCQSGRIGVFDSESNRLTFSARQAKSVKSIVVTDESILYTADTQRVFRFDIRESNEGVVQFQTLSEIQQIAVRGTSICAATCRHGVVASDGRSLQRMISEKHLNSTPPRLCAFASDAGLVACYEDGKPVLWDFFTEDNQELEVPRLIVMRKMQPLGIAAFGEVLAVGYESGVSVYRKGALTEHSTFGQKGRFGPIAHAPCFGKDWVIAVLDESSLVPCQIGGDAAKTVTLHGSIIQSITANNLMVFVAEDDEEGYIGAVMAESFGDEFY